MTRGIQISECYSSGSEHKEMNSSTFLAEMVNEFIEEDAQGSSDRESGRDAANKQSSSREQILHDELKFILLQQESARDYQERKLLADVVQAKDGAGDSSEERCVMSNLRAMGYNAATCKSRWSLSSGITQGEYSYIDVVFEPAAERFIVDTEFSTQFQIARPSEEYVRMFSQIPSVFVGKPEQLHRIIRVVSNAIKLSLKKQELLIPPWRKPEYLRAKWFSTYKRTTNMYKQCSDWKPPTTSTPTRKSAAKAPALKALLTEAGLIQKDRVAHQLVAVS